MDEVRFFGLMMVILGLGPLLVFTIDMVLIIMGKTNGIASAVPAPPMPTWEKWRRINPNEVE